MLAGVTQQISRSFGVYGYAGYERLMGDAADSPIVQSFGSENQFLAGLALFFSFNIGGGS
jgi:outer membrane protein